MKIFNIVVLLVLVLISGCENREFNLPEGDIESGRATFVLLQCNECHTVADVVYVGSDQHDINVTLGGKTTRVKTYADLLTSIINPSHRLSRGNTSKTATAEGKSRMRSYNEFMTVEELTNLVTFLESRYEIWVPNNYVY